MGITIIQEVNLENSPLVLEVKIFLGNLVPDLVPGVIVLLKFFLTALDFIFDVGNSFFIGFLFLVVFSDFRLSPLGVG